MSKYIMCGQSGIYFLFDNCQLVYIGATTDFPRRVLPHHDKKFNRKKLTDLGYMEIQTSNFLNGY